MRTATAAAGRGFAGTGPCNVDDMAYPPRIMLNTSQSRTRMPRVILFA